jgi:Pyruvate/2-oxoacid:ferredoxin oxidoreductase delta subunit
MEAIYLILPPRLSGEVRIAMTWVSSVFMQLTPWGNLLFLPACIKLVIEMSERIGILSFSPTHTTKKICLAVAAGMGAKDPKIMDMTSPDFREQIASDPDTVMADIDHLIVGAPVYFGKLPAQAADGIKSIRGNGKRATAIVVYGNRDYGMALYQMVERLLKNDFAVVATGAFIGQHSYSDIGPVAMGRPDRSDLEKACALGMKSSSVSKSLLLEDIPMQSDFFSRSDKYMPLKPAFISELCIQCGICAECCPMGILSPDTGSYLSKAAEDRCIGCMACVFSCTQKARIAKAKVVMKLALKYILRKASKERKEPFTISA